MFMDLPRQEPDRSLGESSLLVSTGEKKEKAISVVVSIVENEAAMCEMLANWIRHAPGFRCAGVHGSAENALMALPLEKPKVVLMDNNLPGLSGIECVRRLKPLLPDTQFIIFSVCENVDQIFNALAAGASGYLLKRISRAELLAALTAVHASGESIRNSAATNFLQLCHRSDLIPSCLEDLSPRQREVLDLLSHGWSFLDVANFFQVSRNTVSTHVDRIYKKLRVNSRAQAASVYFQAIQRQCI